MKRYKLALVIPGVILMLALIALIIVRGVVTEHDDSILFCPAGTTATDDMTDCEPLR